MRNHLLSIQRQQRWRRRRRASADAHAKRGKSNQPNGGGDVGISLCAIPIIEFRTKFNNHSPSTMSSLLQSILSSKLANASLDEADAQRPAAEDWEEVNTSDDDELVGIQTAPGTRPGTPPGSRPATPASSTANAAPKVKSSLSQDRPVRVKAPKSKTDPLRSLPKEVRGGEADMRL